MKINTSLPTKEKLLFSILCCKYFYKYSQTKGEGKWYFLIERSFSQQGFKILKKYNYLESTRRAHILNEDAINFLIEKRSWLNDQRNKALCTYLSSYNIYNSL